MGFDYMRGEISPYPIDMPVTFNSTVVPVMEGCLLVYLLMLFIKNEVIDDKFSPS